MIKCVTSLLALCNYIVVLQTFHETHPFSSFPQESIKQKCEVLFRGIGKIIEGFVNGGGGDQDLSFRNTGIPPSRYECVM